MTFHHNRLHERNTNPRYGEPIPRRQMRRTLAMWVRTHKPRCDLSGLGVSGWR